MDIEVLRKANLDFAAENQRLRQALRWYAHGNHIALTDRAREIYEDVSGEPRNWQWRHGDFLDDIGYFEGVEGYEDGTLATMVLRGEDIDWDGEEPLPVKGEPEYEISALSEPEEAVSK